MFFCVVLFLFVFFTVVSNKDQNEPNNTSCPTDHTFLRPRRKTLCHDHLEQILNASNVEILHHLVLAT